LLSQNLKFSWNRIVKKEKERKENQKYWQQKFVDIFPENFAQDGKD
jgi:hypothetical protein